MKGSGSKWVKPENNKERGFPGPRVDLACVASYEEIWPGTVHYSYAVRFLMDNGKVVEWKWDYNNSKGRDVEDRTRSEAEYSVRAHLKMCDRVLGLEHDIELTHTEKIDIAVGPAPHEI